MNVNAVGYTSSAYSALKTSKAEETASQEKADTAAQTKQSAKKDQFVKSAKETQVTYAANQKKLTASQLTAEMEQRANSMRNMIQSMIVKQGESSNLSMFGLKLNVSLEQSQAAAASIAEGGEYSVDSVATRIMDMAKALSGGDLSKIDTLRNAVEKGFKAAGVEMGGKLPSISHDTYDEVMKRFDSWEDENN